MSQARGLLELAVTQIECHLVFLSFRFFFFYLTAAALLPDGCVYGVALLYCVRSEEAGRIWARFMAQQLDTPPPINK